MKAQRMETVSNGSRRRQVSWIPMIPPFFLDFAMIDTGIMSNLLCAGSRTFGEFAMSLFTDFVGSFSGLSTCAVSGKAAERAGNLRFLKSSRTQYAHFFVAPVVP